MFQRVLFFAREIGKMYFRVFYFHSKLQFFIESKFAQLIKLKMFERKKTKQTRKYYYFGQIGEREQSHVSASRYFVMRSYL